MNLIKMYKKEINKLTDDIAFKNSMIITMFIVIVLLSLSTLKLTYKVAELNEENAKLNTQIEELEMNNTTLSTQNYALNHKNGLLEAKYQDTIKNASRQVIIALNDMFYIDDIPLTLDQQQYIHKVASMYGIDYEMVIGLIDLESQFDLGAIGYNKNSKDFSLMQVNSKNEEWVEGKLGRELDLMLFKDNIDAGMWLLNYYRDNNIYKMYTQFNKGKQGAKNYFNKHLTYKSEYAMMVLERIRKYKGDE
jgi:soluble lytic murein transglycosylase-like protein